MITRAEVEHVARLARLQLTEPEKERLAGELGAILAYIDTLRQLDTGGVEPTSHAVPRVDVMREDEVVPSLAPEVMLANAPDPAGEFFRVGRIIEV